MRVAAVVVNWNSADDLPACLDALLAQEHTALDIVVVDNASEDGSREVLAAYGDRIRVVWNDRNRGFAGAVNDGVAAAPEADAILTVNPDVTAHPDHVSRLAAVLADHPRCGSVQGKLLRTVPAPDGRDVIDTTGHVAFRTRLFRNRGEGEIDRGQWDAPGVVFGVSGALALYRREMLDDVAVDGEIFDEDLFAFWEDVDLDWRAAMRGWTARCEPAATARHERGGAGPRRTRRVEQLNFQNRLLVIVKCDSAGSLARSLPGVVLTTLLKAVELLVTVPGAFFATFGAVRLVPRMVRKRRAVHGRAVVASTQVVRRDFGRFDYRGWVRTWSRRVRGVPVGTE